MEIVNMLRNMSLFHFMEEKDLQTIIKKAGGTSNLKSGKQIFFEGEKAQFFYIVIEGIVRISRFSKEGKEVVLKDMLPGNCFAEVIIFEQDKYPATATVIEDAIVFKIDKDIFKEALKDHKLAESFMINLIKKVRYLARKVELFNNANVSDRFFHFVETYYGKNESIEFKESKKEIAETIGTIPETFSRMISKLKKNKTIISWEKSNLVFKNGFWNNY